MRQITKELKVLINGKFTTKRNAISKAKEIEQKEHDKACIEQFKQDPLIRQFMEVNNRVLDTYKNTLDCNSGFLDSLSYTLRRLPTHFNATEINSKYAKQLDELNTQEQMLLVQLSYEKDWESIQKVLHDNGIEL